MPSEDMEKLRILESRRNYEAADVWLRNFNEATWEELRTFVTSYCPPDNEMMDLFQKMRRWEAEGVARPIDVPKESTPSGFLEDELRFVSARFRSARLDNLSFVGSTIPPLSYTEALSWRTISPDYFLAPFRDRKVSGGFLTVTGPPRSGKTGIACKIDEYWLDAFPGTEVLTNVPLERPVDGVRPVTNERLLFAGIADALIEGRRWNWTFDEPTLSKYGRGDAATSKAKNIDRFARVIPKYGGSFIYIEQREKGVPTVIEDFAQSRIWCSQPGQVMADLPWKKMPIRSVPKPKRIRYRTGQAGYFEIDPAFDWDGLFRALRFDPILDIVEVDDTKLTGQRILKFLQKVDAPKASKAERPERTCRLCGIPWRPQTDKPKHCPNCHGADPLGVWQAERQEKAMAEAGVGPLAD